MTKPQTKNDLIRAINDEFPGATNSTIKKLCFQRFKIQIESNAIHETLGSEKSRRDLRQEMLKLKLTQAYLKDIGDYRDALRLMRTIRRGGVS